jgi:sortase A
VPADTATAAPLPARLLAGGGSKPIVVASVTSATNAPSIPMQDDDDTSAADGEDAFAAGWFDDEAAWPHVAGWGLLLALISLGAYWVSRRARRNWVGALVGIVPFLVALYFFYENVNRLLPPAL